MEYPCVLHCGYVLLHQVVIDLFVCLTGLLASALVKPDEEVVPILSVIGPTDGLSLIETSQRLDVVAHIVLVHMMHREEEGLSILFSVHVLGSDHVVLVKVSIFIDMEVIRSAWPSGHLVECVVCVIESVHVHPEFTDVRINLPIHGAPEVSETKGHIEIHLATQNLMLVILVVHWTHLHIGLRSVYHLLEKQEAIGDDQEDCQ